MNFSIWAFLMPNESISDDLGNYQVSVDSIESITGIDFFGDLPDSIELAIEAKIDTSNTGWFTD